MFKKVDVAMTIITVDESKKDEKALLSKNGEVISNDNEVPSISKENTEKEDVYRSIDTIPTSYKSKQSPHVGMNHS